MECSAYDHEIIPTGCLSKFDNVNPRDRGSGEC